MSSAKFHPKIVREMVAAGLNIEAQAYALEYANKGNVRAAIAMADIEYSSGCKNSSLAWMRKAEELSKNNVEGKIYLSSAYRRGLGDGNAIHRAKKSIGLLEEVAEAGNVPVIIEMYENYMLGLNGVQKDLERARYWAKKARAAGFDIEI